MRAAFALWITGLPASGKSTITRSLKALLDARDVDAAVLESDKLREVFTVHPRYDDEERAVFYRQMIWVGRLLVQHGVPVIFDATANRRRYREDAKRQFERFLEVYVECPLEVCIARDPKGIYKQGREGAAGNVPGLQAVYEPPENPDLVVRGDQEAPDSAAQQILARLEQSCFLGAI
jgi:adenylylsulfate kinase